MPTFSCRGSATCWLRTMSFLLAVLLAGAVAAQESGGEDAAKTPKAAGETKRLNWPSAWPPQVTGETGAATDAAPKKDAKEPKKDAKEPKSSPAAAKGKSEGAAPVAEPAESVAPSAGSSTAQPEPSPPATQPENAAEPTGETAPAAQPDQANQPEKPQPQAPDEEEPPPVELKTQVAKDVEAAKSVATRLESVVKSVERVHDRYDELAERLPTIEKVLSDAIAAEAKLQPALTDVRSQIAKLGPAPEEGKTEAKDIAAERRRLEAIATEIDGAVKTADLTQVRARQLIARVQELLLNNFRESLFERSPSAFSPVLWTEALGALPDAVKQVVSIFTEWIARANKQLQAVLIVIGLALFFGGGLQFASRRVRRLLRQSDSVSGPSYSRRALVAGLEAPLRMLPKIVFATILYVGLNTLGLLYLQIGGMAVAAYKAVVVASAGLAFTTAYLQPARAQWRVIDLGDPAAWQARRIIRFTVLLFATDVFVRDFISELFLPLPVSILWMTIASLAFAGLFLLGCRITANGSQGAAAGFAYLRGRLHQGPLLIAALAIVVAVLFGFVALGHFIATRLLIVSAAVFLLVIFYLANRAIAAETDPIQAAGTGDEKQMPVEIRRRLGRGLSILLDFVLFVIAVPVVLLALGLRPPEITAFANRMLFGFEVGGIEISLFKIGVALGLFGAIVFLSRMLQKWLGDTVLHPSRTEQGLGNSIRTGVGYMGFLVAVLAGLSYAGLDITNLAIVAGALSVGIGFGLQSIVNNFVSGLILLVERPIKVGDWIKVADTQGYVRRISVRSTEIETFERASVIIPNSELISGTVTNMTLRNALGRLTIPVGVGYGSDPELVQNLLLECAAECESVARHPAPFVVFEDFGDSALIFSLRVYVSNVNSSLLTQTEVRKQIVSKFRAAGIEIPFPQQDLHLRDLDGLKQTLSRVLEERRQANARDVGAHDGAEDGNKG